VTSQPEKTPGMEELGESLEDETHILQAQTAQPLRRDEVLSILVELILYARAKVRDRHVEVREKSTWARVLRESITEWNRMTQGEVETDVNRVREWLRRVEGEKQAKKVVKQLRQVLKDVG